MPLLPVHEMEIDRATSRLELVRVNPTRQFLMAGESGMGLYTWQNGHWYDTGGNEILDVERIPQRFRDEIAANPVQAGLATGPNVTKTCQFCGETMNQSEWDGHMVGHVSAAMQAAGTTTPPPSEPHSVQKITPKSDANQVGRR